MTDEQGTGLGDRGARREAPSEPDAPLARLEQLAARLLGLPLVQVMRAGTGRARSQLDPTTLADAPAFAAALAELPLDGGQPQVVDNARCHPLWRDSPAVRTGQVLAYVALPLFDADGTILGTLCALDSAPRAWTAADLATLTDLAALAGEILGAAAAQQARRQGLHEAMRRALDLPAAPLSYAAFCAAALVDALPVACAAVWLRNAAGEGWSATAYAGMDAVEAYEHTAREPERPLRVASLARAARPYLTTTLPTDPYVTDPAWVAAHGLTTFAAVPLQADRQGLGLLGVFAQEPLPPDILTDLAIIADFLAQVIARARAKQVLEARNAELEARAFERTVQLEAVITTLRQEIAGREQIESALRQSEERYRTLIDLAPDIIYTVSAADGTVLSVNPAFEQLTGWTQAEWLGRPFIDLVHPDDLPFAIHTFLQIAAGAAPTPYQLRLRCKSGIYRIGEFTMAPRIVGGQVIEIFGIGRDVTERQEVLEALRASEERFRRLAENAPDLIYRYDLTPPLAHSYISPAARTVLGYSPAEFYAHPDLLSRIAHPDDRPALHEVLLGQDTTTRHTLRFIHRAGHLVWLDLRRVPIYDAAGTMIAFEGIARDVTEQKLTEGALRDSEGRYRALFAAAQRQAQELALLDQIRTALTRELDLPVVFRTVVEAIAQTFGYTQVSLYLLQQDTLILQHAVGYEQVIEAIPIVAGVAGRVARTGTPVLLEDVGTEPLFIGAIAGITSEICVPLVDQGRVVGILNVESTSDLRLGAADLRLITALGEHINIAIGRARLYTDARQSEERFHALSDLVLEGLGIHENGIIVETNLSLEQMMGYAPGELLGRSVLEIVAPEEHVRAFTNASSHTRQDYEVRMLRKDGTTFPAEIHSRMAPYRGRMLRVVSVHDITERKQAEEALRRQNEELAALHDTTLGLIQQLDPTQLLAAIITRAAALIGTAHGYLYVVEPDQQAMVVRLGIGLFAPQIGYRVLWGEGLSGQVWATGEPLAVADYNSWPGHLPDREPLGMYAIVGIPLRSGSDVVGVIGLAFAEPGRTIGADEIALLNRFAQLASLALENARLYAAAQQELTDRKRAEESMAHLALHDALTDLPNRTLLHERLRQAILEARRGGQTLALLVMDMDRFKEVNDTLGHYFGDVLLRQVGLRLRDGLRASDTVARLGGDEFAVLLPGSDQEGAHWAARKLLTLLEHPFELEGHALDVRISIGIALYPDHGADAETLLRRADVAMYVAKRGGTGYAMYTTEQDPYSPSRLALIGDLRRAIDQEELVLYYQPKLSYRTGRVTGVEALVRWPHAIHGTLNPDQFIPLAEHMGLIKSLSHCVLNIALRQCRAWYDAGWILPVAVNLSLRDLHDARLPEQIGHLLESWALPPSLLHIEITEDTAMSDPGRTLGILTWLRGLGVHLAIDDFGTGQSSLAQLRRLPVDQLKIDKSFVREMAVNDNDAVIVRTIIDLGHNLGLTVVAEGVEDAATTELLTRLGCDEGQGFYLSRAVPPAALIAWLSGQESPPPVAGSPFDFDLGAFC